jgi:starch phosphorylase
MKAALNGALNCSILDGWWDEAYDGRNGWAVESADDDPSLDRRDQREAASLFGLLEQDVVPLFYDRIDGLPLGWLERVKHNWATIGPVFTASRMVRDYVTTYYEPSAAAAERLLADHGAAARALAAWKARVLAGWDAVRVVSISDPDEGEDNFVLGGSRRIEAVVSLGAVNEGDVAVEVVHGRLDADAELVHPVSVELDVVDHRDGQVVYGGAYVPAAAGQYGCNVRVVPSHPDLNNKVELGRIAWAR